MTYRPWKPKKEEPPKDFTWSCFCFCLKYGGLILLGLWLYGVFFQNPSDKNNPTPIPVVAATEKPRRFVKTLVGLNMDKFEAEIFNDDIPHLEVYH